MRFWNQKILQLDWFFCKLDGQECNCLPEYRNILQLIMIYLQLDLSRFIFINKEWIGYCQSLPIVFIFATLMNEFVSSWSVFVTFELLFATRKNRICKWREDICNCEQKICNSRGWTCNSTKNLATWILYFASRSI